MIRRILARLRRRGEPRNHPFHDVHPTGLDYRGLPTAECLCGNRFFYMVAWFSDDYEVAGYVLDGLCAHCGALVTLCTEIDHPSHERN